MTLSIKNALLSFAAVSLVAAAPLGCNLGGTIACDFRDGSVNGPEPRCQERSGIQASSAFKAMCDGLQAESIDGPCPDTPVLGCDISEVEGKVIDWYYAPKTEAEIKEQCDHDGGEIVTP